MTFVIHTGTLPFSPSIQQRDKGKIIPHPNNKETKAKETQSIEYFYSYNYFSSMLKLQQAFKSWSNFGLILFGKGREIHRTTLTNPCNNFIKSIDKFIKELREIHVSILADLCNFSDKSINQFWQIQFEIKSTEWVTWSQDKAMIGLASDKNRAVLDFYCNT